MGFVLVCGSFECNFFWDGVECGVVRSTALMNDGFSTVTNFLYFNAAVDLLEYHRKEK